MIEKNLSSWINSYEHNKSNSWLDLFLQQVLITPDKTAIYFESKTISYQQLDELSDSFAFLVEKNCDEDDLFIGFSIKRSPEMLAAMIGIHKAGKAYLPLDLTFPQERLEYMINDSGLKTILTDNESEIASSLSTGLKIQLINYNKEFTNIQKPARKYNNLRDDIAYILYTSGSTGSPKGVVIQHKALINFLLSMKDLPGCNIDDICLALTTVSFDISMLELLLPLISGASICLLPDYAILSPEKISSEIQNSGVTMIQSTPTVWKILLDLDIKLDYIKKILVGGEALSTSLSRKLLSFGVPVWNMYGPTETTVWSSIQLITNDLTESPPIGMPIRNTGFHILDERMAPVETGSVGQLWISGEGLAAEYWNKSSQTAQNFKRLPTDSKVRIYSTGDYVYEDKRSNILYSGRQDNQVKIRGLRIETDEIEKHILRIDGVKDSVVFPQNDFENNPVLVCFYILEKNNLVINDILLRIQLGKSLPDFMIPTYFKEVSFFPTTPNNKIDKRSLPEITNKVSTKIESTDTSIEMILTSLWKKALNRDNLIESDNFFDLGGNSLLVIQIIHELSQILNIEIRPLFFFENPTLRSQINAFRANVKAEEETEQIDSAENEIHEDEFSLAIIGISCEVPGASNPEEYWELLRSGRSGIKDLSEAELSKCGVPPEEYNSPDYVKRNGSIINPGYFDASFFGYSPNEAKFMDPQHRLMLEHSLKTFESAGIVPEQYQGKIGTFTSCGQNQYLLKNILSSSEKKDYTDFQLMIGNSNDFLATKIAYKFNLKGPALNIQTGCSSSLVAIQLAYQSLINYQCDMALCGGISLNLPMDQGYIHHEGSLLSSDGFCRAFDEEASGTIFSSGLGMILVKRLNEAIREKDPIVAIIRSAAINNDGSDKIGYTAPSINGQKEVIEEAINMAGVTPEDISYIETHGTGTILGDPIEMNALISAFESRDKENKNTCYIGSVKTNIGHLDSAAGILGIIKTALSLKNKKIPASLYFKTSNPGIHFENTPFKVNKQLRNWEPVNNRFLAGVSSFGIGGTNAHIIMESFNKHSTKSKFDGKYLFHLATAKSENSLVRMKEDLSIFLKRISPSDKIDTAFTLKNNRNHYNYRSFVLSDMENNREISNSEIYYYRKNCPSVFLFPGQAPINCDEIYSIYKTNEIFNTYLNLCIELLDKLTGWDSQNLLFNGYKDTTEFTQPLLFAIEWSMAESLIQSGVKCDYLLGHSLGEYVAAVIAGAFDLETGLRIIIERGKLMSLTSIGSMLATSLDIDSQSHLILKKMDIAAENTKDQIVLSGTTVNIEEQKQILEANSIPFKIINNRYAFHSSMMKKVSESFKQFLNEIDFKPIAIPIVSNIDGKVLSPGYIFSSDYWSEHMMKTVLFDRSVKTLLSINTPVFIECGPGKILCKMIKKQKEKHLNCIQTFTNNTLEFILAQIICTGNTLQKNVFNSKINGKVIALPKYRFEETDYWIKPDLTVNSKIKADRLHHDEVKSNVSTEYQLKSIWKKILGHDTIKTEDNFFDLGGDSLLVTQLLKEINNKFNSDIYFRDLIQNPDLNKMTDLIESRLKNKLEHRFEKFPIMFPVQQKGTKKPFFLVAGAHGNRYFNPHTLESSYEEDFLRYFSSLISFLGKDQPIYGFRPRGIIFGEKHHNHVSDMAKEYVSLLKSIQQKGPYIIGGECVGGSVAIEMAKQLIENGDDVSSLILMDTPKPNLCQCVIEELKSTRRSMKKRFSEIDLKLRIYPIILFLIKEIFNLISIYVIGTLSKKSTIRVKESSLYYQRKLLTYKVKKYPGNVNLIINKEWQTKWPNLRWNLNDFESLDVHIVPGNHITRLSEYGHECGSVISQIIDKNE